MKNSGSSLGLIVLLSGVIALSSCSSPQISVAIPEAEACAELISGDAFCRTVLGGKERIIDRSIWKFERIGRPSFNPVDMAEILAFIESICQEGSCTSKQEEMLFEKVEAVKVYQEQLRIMTN